MHPLALARLGLMGLGRLPGFLFRGTGWRKGATGPVQTRPATLSPYTRVRRRYRGGIGRYEPDPIPTRTVRGRVPAGTKAEVDMFGREVPWVGGPDTIPGMGPYSRLAGIGGRFTGKTTQEPLYSRLFRNPATRNQLMAGYARRKPVRTAAAGLGIAGAGALGTYPFIAGDEEPPIDPSLLMTTPEPWAAPEGVLDFAEAEAARAERGEKNIQDMLTKGFLIAAAGGDPSKFFDRGLEVLKASEQYKVDKDYAKVVRAVYKKGDMPKNARDAYERLAPLVGPEKAAVLSGHQLGMEPGKTKEERAWRRIEEIALMGDIDGAAAELVAAWNTGRLKNPAPHITIYSAQLAKAKETLSGVMSGGAGFAEGVQNIRAASA